jgi:hypothetical protein
MGAPSYTYGFLWGPMKVTRMAHIEGRGYSLEISTDHVRMQVYISEKGRVISACEPRSRRQEVD